MRDTGQGISRHFLPQMFQRFRQADSTSTRRHRGLGLGLAIVRHLVELHHGSVKAESAGEGMGATFTVALPLLTGGAERAPLLSSGGNDISAAGTVLEGLHVLVVDDDADTCALLITVLGHYGAQVSAACSVSDALAAVERLWPEVLVSDIAMPGEDGYALLRRIRVLERERGHRLPALALTVHARASDIQQACLAGFEAHVAKPVEPAELVRIIAGLARRRPAA